MLRLSDYRSSSAAPHTHTRDAASIIENPKFRITKSNIDYISYFFSRDQSRKVIVIPSLKWILPLSPCSFLCVWLASLEIVLLPKKKMIGHVAISLNAAATTARIAVSREIVNISKLWLRSLGIQFFGKYKLCYKNEDIFAWRTVWQNWSHWP